MTNGWIVLTTLSGLTVFGGLLAGWYIHATTTPPLTAHPINRDQGRDLAREAFAKASASGNSPGAAALLAELERGWAREDEQDGN